jgi:hypothetical protein
MACLTTGLRFGWCNDFATMRNIFMALLGFFILVIDFWQTNN